jgi:hypothetical protein
MSSAGAAAAAAEKGADDQTITLDLSSDEEELDFTSTPAASLMETGLGGLAMALNLCPEAAASGKRTKMIHKKGELVVDGVALKLKWNADYKAGSVVNLRVVTVKAKEPAVGSDGETEGPVAGRKRARKEPPPIETQLEAIADACIAQGKTGEAEQIRALLRSW